MRRNRFASGHDDHISMKDVLDAIDKRTPEISNAIVQDAFDREQDFGIAAPMGGGGMPPRPGGGMGGAPTPNAPRPATPGMGSSAPQRPPMPGSGSQPYRPSWARDDDKDDL